MRIGLSNISNKKREKKFLKKEEQKIRSTKLRFGLKDRLNDTSPWLKLGILVIALNLLIPLMTFGYYNYYNSTTILIVMFAIMVFLPLLFLFSSIKRSSKISHSDYDSLPFKYRLRKLLQKPRKRLKSIISILLFVIFSVIICIMIFGFNLLWEGLILYGLILLIVCILIPNSFKKTSKPKESSLSWVNEKNRIKQLKQRYHVFKNKVLTEKDKWLRIKAAIVIINLIVFPMILGWSALSLQKEALSAPSFALVPQTFRRNGIEYNLDELDYFDELEDLKDITFNSLMVLRISLGASSPKSITIHTELHPIDVEFSDDFPVETKALIKTHKFSSRAFKGPFSTRDIYIQIDLEKYSKPVLPGKYELEIYSIVQEGFLLGKISNSYKFNVTIEKDFLAFNPDYNNNEITPLRSTRRGSIYSIENKQILGYENHFETRVEDSLGRSVSGEFSLYLTQREQNRQIFKKVADYTTGDDGLISYTHISRTHHREYMRGKIYFNGSQSLWYRDINHYEDSEIAKGKFIYTSQWAESAETTYNGTNFEDFNNNQFQITSHLYYHHEFSLNQLQWTKSPTYSFDSGPPDIIYLNVTDDLSTYIESPIIGYLGTVADIATFTYRYELFNYGTPSDDIYVELQSQVFRDGKLVHEQFDYQGYYNTQGSNWQIVNINLTEYFSEAGQKFQFKIKADFTFDPGYSDYISLRFDYAIVEAYHPPTYYRGFDFRNGYYDFSSPTLSSTDPLYWDTNNLISLGREILTYNNYPGLITNNYFSNDFRLDDSWNLFSGLFSQQGENLIFDERNDINLGPTWRDIDANGMAVFDLMGVNPPINISAIFQSVIKDEFTSVGDSDSNLDDIRQRFVTPKIVSNNKYVIIVFSARYPQDDQWKLYFSYSNRPDGDFSNPVRVFDSGDDALYQLAPSIALSSTDLYITWQQRNRVTHNEGESEWNIMYGRIALDDFQLKDVRNVTAYSSSDINATAMMNPDIALTPLGNVYNENFDLIHTESMVHISYTNASWTNLISGNRDNEDVDDIVKDVYYTQLSSTYYPSSFSSGLRINDYPGSSGGGTTGDSLDIPAQPGNFDLLSAVSNLLGDLEFRDIDVSIFFPTITSTGAAALQFLAKFEESGPSTYDEINYLEGILNGDTFRTSGKDGFGYSFDGNGDISYEENFGSSIYATYANVSYQYNGGGGGGNDFKVIRGTSIISDTATTVIITEGVDYTLESGQDKTSAFIRLTNTRLTGMGKTSGGGNQNHENWAVRVQNPGNIATSITFERDGTTSDSRVTWEILQYIGVDGGDNEIIVTDVGTTTASGTTNYIDGTSLSNITNTNKVAIFITGQYAVSASRSNVQYALFTSELFGSGPYTPRFTRSQSVASNDGVSYAVVEFTGSNWADVQRLDISTESTTAWTTSNYATAYVDVSITSEGGRALTNYSRAFLIQQFRTTTDPTGLDDAGDNVELISDTQLRIRQSATSGTRNKVVYIIENLQSSGTTMSVEHGMFYDSTTSGSEERSWTQTINTVLDIDTTSVFAQVSVDGSGTAFSKGAIDYRLTSTSQITFTESDAGQERVITYDVIQWPSAGGVGLIQNSSLLSPDGDVTTQWNSSAPTNHFALLSESVYEPSTPDTASGYIFTSSKTQGSSIIDEFFMNSTSISGGNVTQIQIKVYGNESSIDSTVDVYVGSWLGAKQLDMGSTSGWNTYLWSGLNLDQTDLDGMQIRFTSVIPPEGTPIYSNFDFVQFGNILNFPLGSTNDQFMISAWVYPTAFTSNESNNGVKNTFVSKNGNLEIGINESGYITIYIKSNGVETTAFYGASGAVPLNDWSRIILVYDQSNVDVFIGSTWYYSAIGVAEPWTGGGSLVSGGDFVVGGELTNYSSFSGLLDEVGVYNTTVTYFPDMSNMTFTTNFSMSNKPAQYDLFGVKLLYSYKTNQSQQITLSLFNYNTLQYDVIETASHTTYFVGEYEFTSSDYYNQNFEVNAKISGISGSQFEFYLDQYILNYSWTIPSPGSSQNFNGNLETPQIINQLHLNSTTITKDSTEITVNFGQTTSTRVFKISSISVKSHSGQDIVLFRSEEEFVKLFGNQSILFDQNKIVFPDDRMFMDMYDPRTFYFSSSTTIPGITEYELKPFFYDNVSLVKEIKDVYYSNTLLPAYQIESNAQRLNRNNYSFIGTFGTENLNISFNFELPTGSYFYVKYSLEDYLKPQNITIEVSTVTNELAFIFERVISGSSDKEVYLDVSTNTFQFQNDILISNSSIDVNISRQADIKYDYNDLLNIIYSSVVNGSYSRMIFKHMMYNSSSGLFDNEETISDPINLANYDYYKMLNPIINFNFNNTMFIAYETNYKKIGEEAKWKVQYMYLDVITSEKFGPYYIVSSESSQEKSPDSYWSNGLFWTFSVNNSNNWDIQYTSSRRADLTSFSTLAADFYPQLFNRDMFYGNMSIYFNLDLGSFVNDLLESDDQIRFIVSIESGGTQYILLDTNWNSQDLTTWIQNNLGTYYPRYLRYFYNLSFSSLTYTDINAVDDRLQNGVFPFELNFPNFINFTEHFNLRFNLVKDDWSLNASYDMDRFQLGIDNVDISFEIIPRNYTSNTFGILTRSDASASYAMSEFLISNKVDLSTLSFFSDSTFIQSDNNMVDLLIDFDAFSLIFDPISQLQYSPYSDLEVEMSIMVENDASPDLVISDEIFYQDFFTGYSLQDIKLESKWSKNFGILFYFLNMVNNTVDIINKDTYFSLSTAEKRALFSLFESLAINYENIYIIFKFKVKTLDLNSYGYQNGISLIFNEFKLPVNWQNGSGIQVQDIQVSRENNAFTFFEKISKNANLNVLSDLNIQLYNRNDFITFSSFSDSFYLSNSQGNNLFYLPSNREDIQYITPSNYLNLVNLHASDCIGYYDTYNGVLIDGPELKSEVGIVSPNLYSNETADYNLRAILYTYPFFNFQNGTDLDKAFQEFKTELLKIKVEVFNQFNNIYMSEYSKTIIKMQDFDISDFNNTINSRGEKFYFMKSPLKIYIYGENIITSTEYIYLKLISEFFDTYYVTPEKAFRNQWGIFIDDLKFEFIQDAILPEFTNIQSFDTFSEVVDIEVRAIGDNYEWAALYYNYMDMGQYDGYDLIANNTQYTLQGDYAHFNFTWNTTDLADDTIYKLRVVMQNDIGFYGNTTLSNITVINSPPNITIQAFSLSDQGWNTINDLDEVSGYIKLTTTNNDVLPLTKVKYYFNDEYPTDQNKVNWTKLVEYAGPSQTFDHYIYTDNIPNGTWYIIAEAHNGGLNVTSSVYTNRTIINKFSNALNIGNTVSKFDTVGLSLPQVTESQIEFAKFWAKKQGTSNWTLLNNATFAPFSAPLSNL
ncbi:hypothetical protein LCGC14_0824170, partial [marine sediment metagenome]